MFRSVIVIVACVAVFSTTTADNECSKLGEHGLKRCCKKFNMPRGPPPHGKPPHDRSQFEKCRAMHDADPDSCDSYICVAKLMGYSKDDGTLDDKQIIIESMENHVKDATLLEKLKKNCVEGDISKFALSPDSCELSGFMRCHEAVKFSSCEDWSDEDNCKDMKELVEKCVQ